MALPVRVARNQGSIDPFELMRQDMGTLGRLFGRGLWGDGDGDGGTAALSHYGVDIREDADHVYIEADVPGFRKEDVDIRLENGTLTIAAEQREETPAPAPAAAEQTQSASQQSGQQSGQSAAQQRPAEYLLRERRYRRFLRSFTLPPDVDEQNVQAQLEHGVLKITLNRREETKPRKIEVR